MKAVAYTFAVLGLIFFLGWRLGKFLKDADNTPRPEEDWYKCTNCGFTTTRKLGICPVCKQ